MEAPSKYRAGKRKAGEQRDVEEEGCASLPFSSAPTGAATTLTSTATPIDERNETPHSGSAPPPPPPPPSPPRRRLRRRQTGAALSPTASPGRKQNQRSQTGVFSLPQDKDEQGSLKDQDGQNPPLPSYSLTSSHRTRLGGRRSRGRESPPPILPSSSVFGMSLSSRRKSSGLSRTVASSATSSTSPPQQGAIAAPSPPLPPHEETFAGPSSSLAKQSNKSVDLHRRHSFRARTSSSGADKEHRRYLLHVLQQPKTGCAFGSNLLSRLAVAPPLIVQLQAIDRAGREISLEADLPFLICQVQLADGDGQPIDMLTVTATTTATPSTLAPASSSASSPPPVSATSATTAPPISVRLLYGTLVASPLQLYTQDNRPAIIFVFPEISIRSRGRFQLDVSLMRLPFPTASLVPASTLATASTEPFDVVLSTDYVAPEVTDITRHFARQGVGLLLPPDQAQSGPTAD